MNFRSSLRFRHAAFTRVELIVVIAVIVIFVGLLFPAGHPITTQANKVKARTDVVNTVAAVKQYYTEYGAYPLANQVTNKDITFGDKSSGAGGTVVPNNQLYDILRNYPNDAVDTRPSPDGNSRQIVFFEGRNGIPTSGNPRSGFAGSGTTGTGTLGCFYDPWGNQYAISVDGSGDGWVPVPYLDFPAPSGSSNLPATCVKSGCAAWSVGKDGKIGRGGDFYYNKGGTTPSDDLISWQ
jgi:type II secretory pathway pseudopilin PulG